VFLVNMVNGYFGPNIWRGGGRWLGNVGQEPFAFGCLAVWIIESVNAGQCEVPTPAKTSGAPFYPPWDIVGFFPEYSVLRMEYPVVLVQVGKVGKAGR
jgi:hypothetical protein